MDVVDDIKDNGEEGAKRLYAEYGGRLMAAAVVLCGDTAHAEDLVSETMSIAVREIDKFRKEAPIFEWLYGIMQNLYRQTMRRKSATNEIPVAEMPETSADNVVDGISQIEDAIDGAILRDAVKSLSPDMREAVVLHYFMDMPILKIAKFVATPVGTVKSRLHYARVELKRRLGVKLAKPMVVLAAAALFLIASAAVVVASISESSPESIPESTTGRAASPLAAAESSSGRAASPLAADSAARPESAPYQSAESQAISSTSIGATQMPVKNIAASAAFATLFLLPMRASSVGGASCAEATFDSFSSAYGGSGEYVPEAFLSRYRTMDDSNALSSFNSHKARGFVMNIR